MIPIAPLVMIVGRKFLNTMKASLDFEKEIKTFRLKGAATRIRLFMEREIGGGHVSDEFTSDEESDEDDVEWITEDDIENDEEDEDSDDVSHDELVLQLREKGTNMMGLYKEEAVDSSLNNLSQDQQRDVRREL